MTRMKNVLVQLNYFEKQMFSATEKIIHKKWNKKKDWRKWPKKKPKWVQLFRYFFIFFFIIWNTICNWTLDLGHLLLSQTTGWRPNIVSICSINIAINECRRQLWNCFNGHRYKHKRRWEIGETENTLQWINERDDTKQRQWVKQTSTSLTNAFDSNLRYCPGQRKLQCERRQKKKKKKQKKTHGKSLNVIIFN